MPREEDEFTLSYYNSMTTWIDIDKLLGLFGLTRDDILAREEKKILAGIRKVGSSLSHLYHAQRSEKALGPRPGRRFPRNTIRKTLG